MRACLVSGFAFGLDDAGAGRLREACLLFTSRMLEPDVTIGMTLTGALTPAGLGMAALILPTDPQHDDK